MSCCGGSDEKRRSRALEKEIRKGKRKRAPYLLLLGAGKSGKSTFLKQMRILHSSGFTKVEREAEYRPLIAQNVVLCVKSLHQGMLRLGLKYYAMQNGQLGEAMLDYIAEGYLHEGLADQFSTFWLDPSIQECYSRQREFGYELPDSTKYFLDNVMRLGGSEYTPTNQDIIQSRSPTLSIQEFSFTMEKRQIAIVDVGGQPSERRKWVHLFDGVRGVIFLAAISEYDQVDRDTGENLLKHSMALMGTLLSTPFFTRSGFIVFMNKMDVFQDKISYVPLRHYFPEYHGPQGNAKAAADFLEHQFCEIAPGHSGGVPQRRGRSPSISAAMSSLRRGTSLSAQEHPEEHLIYLHRTTATNTENIRNIFEAVRNIVLINLLENIGVTS